MVLGRVLLACLGLVLAPSVVASEISAPAPLRVPSSVPNTVLVDSLNGFPLDGSIGDDHSASVVIGSILGWEEGAIGPEFTPEYGTTLTEVGGVVSSCIEGYASGQPTCVNPQPLLVEVRQSTTFGCYYYSAYGRCPDTSPAGLLGIFPMSFRGDPSAFKYERARMNLPLEGGRTYYALFRRQPGASPGSLLMFVGGPDGTYAYVGGNVLLGGFTPSQSWSVWDQAGVRVIVRPALSLW